MRLEREALRALRAVKKRSTQTSSVKVMETMAMLRTVKRFFSGAVAASTTIGDAAGAAAFVAGSVDSGVVAMGACAV